MNDFLDMSDLIEVYYEEADEQLQKLDDGILALERCPDDISVVNEIFRAAHTLKGSSASVGFEHIASLTHSMENLLDTVREGKLSVTTPIVEALLLSVDVLRELVQRTRGGDTSKCERVDKAIEAIKGVSGGECSTNEKKAQTVSARNVEPVKEGTVRIEVGIAEDCAMPSVRGFMVFSALSDKGEVISSDPSEEQLEQLQSGGVLTIGFRPSVSIEELRAAMESILEISTQIYQNTHETPRQPEVLKGECEQHARSMQTVRVGVDRLDTLMNLVGELVIDRTRIGRIESELSSAYEGDRFVGDLGESSLHLGRVINELQEQIMKIRMLPVDQVFNRFPRMVRDLAQKSGKKVNFAISGQDTELDRSILEDIVDPITHLLRNSIDHGVETPEKRKAAGKPETGTIHLTAKHEENRIVIEVEDDGAGISREGVVAAAVNKGTISREAADRLTDKECLQLIFGAGVSTAEKVTDVSGRGVGMDVVRSNIERLSGIIDVESEPGEGTRISLKLPLTLAIVQALVTSVQDRTFAIPLTEVVETSHYRQSDIKSIEGRPVIKFRNSVLPITGLGELFRSAKAPSAGIDEESVLVVVRAGGEQIGLAVDKLVGEQEVVIKSLGSYFGQVEGISGAALLGDGNIALIVDVSGLPAIVSRGLRAAA